MKRNPEYDHIREQFKDVEDPELKKLLIKRAINSYWKKHNKDKTRLERMRFRAKYPEKIKAQNKRFKEKNPNYKKEYYQKNKERAKEYWQNRTEEQKNAKAKYNRKWKNEQYKNNVEFRLHCVISTAVRRSLLTEKDDYIKNLLGYTIEELKNHLESQFEDWMTWDNFGLTAKKPKETWQIDHIIPANTFNITSTDSEEFRKCWALENLRPLDSFANVRRPKNGSDIKKE
jgi:hypothetical protein